MEKWNLLLAFLVTALIGAHAQVSPCSFANRAINMDACLSAIRSQAIDENNGPYGTAYFERCPLGDRHHINCFEVDPIFKPKSLSELTFMVANQDLSTIDRFLSMRYTSHAGGYTGCDHTYSYPNEKTFFIDPIADVAFPSWDLRDAPVSSWDYVEGDLFTLIGLDPMGATKDTIINIEGNDFTNAMHLVPYAGPWTHINISRPFTFTIYKQPNRLLPQRIPLSNFNVTEFAERNKLQGPVAFSWLKASYDAYSVERYPFGQNCASLVQDELRQFLPRFDFLPSPDDLDLRIFLHVEFTTGPITFNCGNYSVTKPANNVIIDPLTTDVLIDTADLRMDSLRTLHFEMNKIDPHPSDFTGKLYTLMRLDPETKHVYGLLVNLEMSGDDFTSQGLGVGSGDIILTSQPVSPPNDGKHHPVMFLLYEQTAPLSASLDLTPYLQVSCGHSRDFDDLAGFIVDHQLDLVGTSLMLVQYDEYTRCTTTLG